MRRPGFTMLELMLTLGIFSGLSLLAMPYVIASLQHDKVQDAAKDLSSSLFLTQQRAASGLDGKSYGVAFTADSDFYSVFIGNSLATAEDIDERDLPFGVIIQDIELSGDASELTFAPNSFRPTNTGRVLLSDGSLEFAVALNSEGLIEWYREVEP